MVKFGVREKIMVIFLILLFIPLIFLGVVSIIGVKEVGTTAVDDSRKSLSDQAEANLMSLVQDKANETSLFFGGIAADTSILMDYGNEVYNHPEKFHNASNYPDHHYDDKIVPYLPDWGYVHSANDERKGAWSDWDMKVQTTPYLNSSVVKRAAQDPVYAAWLKDEINKTTLFDQVFKPIYDKNQPNVVLVWLVRHGGLTNSYSLSPLDYGEMLAAGDLTDDWDEDVEDYVTLASPKHNPGKGIVWTDPYFDPVGNGWMISCLGPLYLDDQFIGDMGIDITLDVIRDIVLGVKVLETGHAFLINRQGEAISHMDLDGVRSEQMKVDEEDIYVDITDLESKTSDFGDVVSKMKNLETGMTVVRYENRARNYIAYAPIESTGFSIGVVVSEDEINALVESTEEKMNDTTNRSVWIIVIMVLLTVIGVIVASVFLAGRITRPISQLTILTERITKGNLNFEFTEEYDDEMRVLASSFKNMLITLRLGNVAYYEGDTKRAFENYKSALSLFSATDNKQGQAMSLNNLGNIYRTWGDHSSALRHYNKAVQLDKKGKNTKGITSRNLNIGLTYKEMEEDDKAMDHFNLALKLSVKSDDKKGMARAYNNLGLMSIEEGDADTALDHFLKAYEIDVELNDRRGLSSRLNNMAMLHKKSGDHDRALSLLKKSLTLSESYEDKTGIMNNLSNIIKVCQDMGDYAATEKYKKRFNTIQDQILKSVRKKTVIFVIDTSGSMEGERLDAAKNGAMNLYKRKVYDEDLVSLIEFHSKAIMLVPPTAKKDATKTFPMALNKIYASGLTAFYDALGDSLKAISRSDDQDMIYWIVALTDGEDNSSFRFTKQSVIKRRDTIPQDVTLVIISVGDAVMQDDLEELCGYKGKYIVVGQEGDAEIGSEIKKAYRQVEEIFESSEVVEGFVPEG